MLEQRGTLSSMVKVNSDSKPLIDAFLAQGYDVDKGQNSHLVVRPTQARREWLARHGFDVKNMDPHVILASTPSDWRSVRNSIKDAEKGIGFNYAPPAWSDPDRLESLRVSDVLEAYGSDGVTPWEAASLTGIPEKNVRSILNGLGKQNGKRKAPGRAQSQTVYVLKNIDIPKISAESLFGCANPRNRPQEPAETAKVPAPAPEVEERPRGLGEPRTARFAESSFTPGPGPVESTTLADLTELVDMILALPVSMLESKDCRAQIERLLPLTAALIVAENLHS